ncbi:helix-turn-helix transcriptional regulator [Albimonas sp. CAU 1670]|uniref:helix-turn-helix transcriptional regulator n=1 Tax=Albimonas sp. CAU 1670 TaxID=3032599 RepID=UPI0023DBAB33|nr:helix-turn-helix transcriptional regulator [Albimonas sp. CAU 1670]MDF2234914.1 helix-turn-helix transcriptional regulator [Albimonas sp. CAU 1670]
MVPPSPEELALLALGVALGDHSPEEFLVKLTCSPEISKASSFAVGIDGETPTDQLQTGIPEEAWKAYTEEFYQLDPWTGPVLRAAQRRSFNVASRLVDPEQTERSAFRNRFLKPFDLYGDAASVVLHRLDGRPVALAMYSSLSQGSFDAGFERSVAPLLPAIQSFMRLRDLAVAQTLDGALRSEPGVSTAVLASDLSLLATSDDFANRSSAQASMDRRGRLTLKNREAQRTLAALAASTRDGAVASAEPVRLADSEAGRMTARIAVFEDTRWFFRRMSVVLTIEPPLQERRSLLRRRLGELGLTPSEIDVALMATDGHSPANVAERRGRSILTVRTQLRNVMAKLDCRSIAQLAAKIASI